MLLGRLLLGLMGYELAWRWIATMKPASAALQARWPWYGRNAAAAIQLRPSPYVLGCLAWVGLFGLLTLSRTIGAGFLLGVARAVALWYLLPLVLHVRNPNAPSLANRLLALEQFAVQKPLSRMFERWDTVPPLACGQSPQAPFIYGPLETTAPPQVRFVLEPKTCEYEVEAGRDLDELLAATGVQRAEIEDLNGVERGQLEWIAGKRVVLPRQACLWVIEHWGENNATQGR